MRFVVVGGGVAGTSCALQLCKLCPDSSVTLVAPDATLKSVHTVDHISQRTEEYEVREHHAAALQKDNLSIIQAGAKQLDTAKKLLHVADGTCLPYDRICICTGATPKVVVQSRHVITLRDASSVAELDTRLQKARRVVLVGNGGIALELAHALRSKHAGTCDQIRPLLTVGTAQVVWVMKQDHIGDAFFDLDAAAFLLMQLERADPQHAQQEREQHAAGQHQMPPGSAAERHSAPEQADQQPGSDFSFPRQSDEDFSFPPITEDTDSPQAAPATNGSHREAGNAYWANGQQPKASASAPANSNRGGTAGTSGREGTQQMRAGSPQHVPFHMKKSSSGAEGSLYEQLSASPGLQSMLSASSPSEASGGSQQKGKPLWECKQHGSNGALTSLQSSSEQDEMPSSSVSVVHGRRNGQYGHAVGPHWTQAVSASSSGPGSLVLEQGCELISLDDRAASSGEAGQAWPVQIRLSNGHTHNADLVISAIGVQPTTTWLPKGLHTDPQDGGVLVDRGMETSVPGVYAAGDVCKAAWKDMSPHWFQMRLWTQAKLMGLHAAYSMAGHLDQGEAVLNLELFTHVTRFLGHRIVLLGLYNGQRLHDEPDSDIVTYTRSTEGGSATFVRVLLLRGRLMGAVLIGKTGLEEAFENLILDGLDLTSIGPELLDPEVDIDAIFD